MGTAIRSLCLIKNNVPCQSEKPAQFNPSICTHSLGVGLDNANCLTSVDNIPYTFDANGNLLSDGENAYDSTNRLISVTSSQSAVTSYQYNGLDDRL